MRKEKVNWIREETDYMHRVAWMVVKRQFDRPSDARQGAIYDDLVAMVFLLHTLEGYLNYVGEQICPDVWRNEREITDGIVGKLLIVTRQCDMPDFDRSRRPYSTITDLKQLRNAIVHPKVKRNSIDKIYAIGRCPALFRRSYIETIVSKEKALRAKTDITTIIESIQHAANLKFPARDFEEDALDSAISSTTDRARFVKEAP